MSKKKETPFKWRFSVSRQCLAVGWGEKRSGTRARERDGAWGGSTGIEIKRRGMSPPSSSSSSSSPQSGTGSGRSCGGRKEEFSQKQTWQIRRLLECVTRMVLLFGIPVMLWSASCAWRRRDGEDDAIARAEGTRAQQSDACPCVSACLCTLYGCC